ncbi:MAG: type I-C CRISPR-associated protein Cas7/Csd2 [Acidobacteria bacterium]|nr:type I-C CRISPR-associated protein Cas7/Csd2 [Acidobacteriota bacterium]
MNNALTRRHDFVYLFDVANGNPNGDPDAGNLPRTDPDSNHGLVTDVCLKRKVRNYVQLLAQKGCDIFVQSRRALNPLIAEACKAAGQADHAKDGGGYDKAKAKGRSQAEIGEVQAWLCRKYYDIRTFGAVLSSGPNAGQVRGPVQFTFARSVEPIQPQEHTITRIADVDTEETEMGRKSIVPYGLYRMHGFVSAAIAGHTGFSADDLDILCTALKEMFDHDRSTSRGEMTARGLYLFEHATPLGNAPSHRLTSRITVARAGDGAAPARRFEDYTVRVDESDLPSGVWLHPWIG